MRRRYALALGILLLAACRAPVPTTGIRFEGVQETTECDLLFAAEPELIRYGENDQRLADAYDAAHQMEFYLRELGYPEARVEMVPEEDENGVLFRVSEGTKAEFGGVRFEGVHSIPESELRPFFDFEGTFLGLGPTLYNPNAVDAAVSAVEDLYRERGYYRVDAEDEGFEWDAYKCRATAVVVVEEGPQYLVSDIECGGAPECLPEEDYTGKPFRPRLPVLIAAAVRRCLREKGYALAQVTAHTDIDDETARVSIRIEADKGEPLRLRDVRFTGQRRTKERFMRRRIPLQTGDVIVRSELEEGVAQLFRSRNFDRVDADVVPVAEGQADLEFTVEEAESRRVEAFVGWGAYEQLMGRAAFWDDNLFGWGRHLKVGVHASLKDIGAEVLLEDPWILGIDNRLFWHNEVRRRIEPFYTYRRFATELGVERRLDEHHRIWASYLFSIDDAFDVAAELPPDIEDQISGFSRSAGIMLKARRDTRDDLFLPKSGHRIDVAGFLSDPVLGATLRYVELEVRASTYFDLSGAGVLALGGFFGSRHPYGGTDTLPLQLRYFLGGPDSVRSFGRDELTPTDGFGNGIGGLTAAEARLEWRRPLTADFHGAAFAEVGVVGVPDFSFDGAWGYGVGAGLRYYTPVGPVRLDVAYNPGPLNAATDRWQVWFAFGFGF